MLRKAARFGLVKAAAPVDVAGMPVSVIRARIATLSAVDSEGDTYERGAFAGNDDVALSPYNHAAWGPGASALPIGRGAVFENGDFAEFAGVLVLSGASAQSHYELLKAMGETQAWSYGYDVLRERRPASGDPYGARRVLQRLKVHEVSPVLAAAGSGTQTLAIDGEDVTKDEALVEFLRYVRNSWEVR